MSYAIRLTGYRLKYGQGRQGRAPAQRVRAAAAEGLQAREASENGGRLSQPHDRAHLQVEGHLQTQRQAHERHRACRCGPSQRHSYSGRRFTQAPVIYSEELAEHICERLCDGESLNSICISDDMPSERAVRLWAADPEHPFAPKYARAREVGYIKMADEIVAIADGLAAGDGKADPAAVQRDRLRFDARRWLLSKALPKVYGDRLEVDAKTGLVVVETPAAVKALLEALPELASPGCRRWRLRRRLRRRRGSARLPPRLSLGSGRRDAHAIDRPYSKPCHERIVILAGERRSGSPRRWWAQGGEREGPWPGPHAAALG